MKNISILPEIKHNEIKIGDQFSEIGTPYYIYTVTEVIPEVKNIGLNTYIKLAKCKTRTVTGRQLESDYYMNFSENSKGQFSTNRYLKK